MIYKTLLSFLFLFFIVLTTQAQSKYWVYFKDKAACDYALSDRALERRLIQSISLDESDKSVSSKYLIALKQLGAHPINISRWLNAVSVEADEKLLSEIKSADFVSRVALVKRIASQAEGPSLATKTFHAGPDDTSYSRSYVQVDMLRGRQLHQKHFMGQGMLIAVLDAGFTSVDTVYAFEELRSRQGIRAVYDFVDQDTSVYEKGQHGTSVLSTMAAWHPGEMIGTAPGADYILLRSEEGDQERIIEEDNWVAAAEFADSAGADIINSSLGYTTYDDSLDSHTYEDMDGETTVITLGADMAASKGILVVNSAGNSGDDDWRYIGAPADGKLVLTVGAVMADLSPANFTSLGPSFDGRVKPEVSALGHQATVVFKDNTYGYSNGTSFSSPIIAGMAACLWQAHPHLTSLELRDAIIASAHQFENPDTLIGYGIPNFYEAHQQLIVDNPAKFDRSNIATIWPNPFHSNLNLTLFDETGTLTHIGLYNVQGELLEATYWQSGWANFNNYAFKVASQLASGIYFVKVRSRYAEITLKVIRI